MNKKTVVLLGKIENSKYPEDETCIQKVQTEGVIIGYARISVDALAQLYGGSLDSVWAPNFFDLILQEF